MLLDSAGYGVMEPTRVGVEAEREWVLESGWSGCFSFVREEVSECLECSERRETWETWYADFSFDMLAWFWYIYRWDVLSMGWKWLSWRPFYRDLGTGGFTRFSIHDIVSFYYGSSILNTCCTNISYF